MFLHLYHVTKAMNTKESEFIKNYVFYMMKIIMDFMEKNFNKNDTCIIWEYLMSHECQLFVESQGRFWILAVD